MFVERRRRLVVVRGLDLQNGGERKGEKGGIDDVAMKATGVMLFISHIMAKRTASK